MYLCTCTSTHTHTGSTTMSSYLAWTLEKQSIITHSASDNGNCCSNSSSNNNSNNSSSMYCNILLLKPCCNHMYIHIDVCVFSCIKANGRTNDDSDKTYRERKQLNTHTHTLTYITLWKFLHLVWLVLSYLLLFLFCPWRLYSVCPSEPSLLLASWSYILSVFCMFVPFFKET